MKRQPITHPRRLACAIGTACTMLMLSGCGGGPPEAYPDTLEAAAEVQSLPAEAGAANPQPSADTTAQASQKLQAAQAARTLHHAGNARIQSARRMDATSFTLNSSTQFKGFNPQVWNDHKSWYECDCGRKSQAQPSTMPWNPAG